jgi:hypothetical protein
MLPSLGRSRTLALAILVASTGLGADKCKGVKELCPCGVRVAADGSINCLSCESASASPAPPGPTAPATSPEPSSPPSPTASPVTTLPSSPAPVAHADCPAVPKEAAPEPNGCAKDESKWSREYNAAVDEVCAAHGLSGCSGGGVLWTFPWKNYIQELQARLDVHGFCSGHDYDNGDQDPEAGVGVNPSPASRGFGSEMGIRLAGTTAREEFFAPLSTAKKIRPAPGAYMGSCSPAVEPYPFRAAAAPAAAPSPVAATTPVTPTTPASPAAATPTTPDTPIAPVVAATSKCPLPKGEGRWIEAGIENIGRPPVSQQISVSTKWCSEVDPRDPSTGRMSPPDWPFTGPAGSCGTKCCRIGAHEGALGIACEADRFGTPTWSVVAGDARIVELDNPFNVKIAEGEGRVRVCGSAVPTVCTEAAVRAQVGPVIGR